MSALRELLARAVELEASDVHIKPNQEPFFRVHGALTESGFETVTAEYMWEVVKEVIPPHVQRAFETEHEGDFSHFEEGVGRFRVNVFLSQGVPTLAMRHVKTRIPTFEDLRLPLQLRKLAHAPWGIIVLCGTTGSGKSTTLAAMMGEINRTERQRIITIEDPIEYMFEDDQSIVTQREVGLDTLTFQNALKHLMRQDPDVILIGEMRDRTSIRTALLAAETGHLVLTTLHAGTADQAVPRVLDVFPAEEQDQIRLGMASNLQAAVCQRLIPDVTGRVVPAVEILVNTPTVRKLIEKSRLEVLGAAIETGKEDGMQSFNQAIYGLIKNGTISENEGMRFATNPESLRMNLEGIFLDEDRRILSEIG
jgi:twitching motility protein PilT